MSHHYNRALARAAGHQAYINPMFCKNERHGPTRFVDTNECVDCTRALGVSRVKTQRLGTTDARCCNHILVHTDDYPAMLALAHVLNHHRYNRGYISSDQPDRLTVEQSLKEIYPD